MPSMYTWPSIPLSTRMYANICSLTTTAYMYEPLQNGSEIYEKSSDSEDSFSSNDEGACGGLDAADFTHDTDALRYPDHSSDSTVPKW